MLNRAAVQCCRLGHRQMMTSAARNGAKKGEVHPGYKKIKAKYEQFQVDDGVPVHLKGGPTDRILYMTTLALCGVGLLGSAEFIYRASFPKKC